MNITPKAQALLNSDAPFYVRSALNAAMERAPVDAIEHARLLHEAVAEWAAAKLQDENERFARMRPEPEAVAA